jgi:hypothetical protein
MPRHRLPAGVIVVLLGLALVGGCQPQTSAPASPTASKAAVASPAARAACAPLDLRAPDGTRLDLSGTWREPGGGPVYYL